MEWVRCYNLIRMTPEHEHADIKGMLERNADLLEENNSILKKIHRNAVWTFWFRIMWYVILIGLPFAFYFYVVEPYFALFGSNYEIFRAGIGEIPGIKGFEQFLGEGQ